MIPYGKQNISDSDIQAVVNVLKSDYLTQGPAIPAFERGVCDYTGAKFGVAVNSATSALHIACLALGVGKGDFVWTSPITFVASSNCALYCDAEVDFVDIDPRTYNMCPIELEKKLVWAEKNNKLPKVVIPVHMTGQSAEMEAIHRLSLKYGFKIIEDASHSIGSKYLYKPVGSCQFSDICVFSFHPVKIITSAEGGMAMTNNPEYAQRMEMFRSHGITRDSGLMTAQSKDEGSWYYQQLLLGYNYRMTDIHAALGLSQLSRLDEFVSKRHKLASYYNEALSELPLVSPFQLESGYSSYHLYIIQLELDKVSVSHKDFFEALRSSGIGVNLHYIPVHTQPYYQGLGFKFGDYPKSEAFYQRAVSIPLYPDLSREDQDFVVSEMKRVLEGSSK